MGVVGRGWLAGGGWQKIKIRMDWNDVCVCMCVH